MSAMVGSVAIFFFLIIIPFYISIVIIAIASCIRFDEVSVFQFVQSI